MGIDRVTLAYLSSVSKMGETLTVGRQGVYISGMEGYCEPIFSERFGATKIDSVDNSDYEQATIIHDMNHPWKPPQKYDTVFDGGCLEHIYNVPQALVNISNACKVGGQIIHILPTNNYCGHGFYQFSPELFFSLYKESNGYRDTTVHVCDMSNGQVTVVPKPENGRRVEYRSSTEMVVMVRTVLNGEFRHYVQQSDYEHEWKKPS
jgi:hypothetical protein